MYEKLKKASLKGAIGVSVVLFIVGGLLIGFFGKGAVYAIKGYDYLDDIMPTDLKDQFVELDLNVCFGGYLKSSEKNTDTGKVTVKSYNYVIQAFDYTEAGDEYEYQDRYMSIKIPPKMMDQLDAISLSGTRESGWMPSPIRPTPICTARRIRLPSPFICTAGSESFRTMSTVIS